MKNIITICISILIVSSVFGNTIIVTNTNDSGVGSLRQAISDANSHVNEPDSIIFQIPTSDPNYVDSAGVWIICPLTELTQIEDHGTCIDGRSQSKFIGSDKNPLGPEIVLDGSYSYSKFAAGLWITGDRARIWHLNIRGFKHPNIWIDGNHNNIAACYLGTDHTGTKPPPDSANGGAGILIQNGDGNQINPPDTSFNRNVIASNKDAQILITSNAIHNAVIANILGLRVDLTSGLGFPSIGVRIDQSADCNFVFDNIIGGGNIGIVLQGAVSYNEIGNNAIGTDHSWEKNWANKFDGIYINDATNNFIFENVIGKNGSNGININYAQATGNLITHNSISDNNYKGIKNNTGAINPPVITQISSNSISGTSSPNTRVEFYADPEDEGQIFLGDKTVDASGNFFWQGDIPPELYVTAIAIDASNNTSEFSLPQQYSPVSGNTEQAVPLKYRLFQNYPNPFNSSTEIQYSLLKPVKVIICVFNMLGEEVIVLANEDKDAGDHMVSWNGKDFYGNSVPSGIYIYCLSINNYVTYKKMLLLQ